MVSSLTPTHSYFGFLARVISSLHSAVQHKHVSHFLKSMGWCVPPTRCDTVDQTTQNHSRLLEAIDQEQAPEKASHMLRCPVRRKLGLRRSERCVTESWKWQNKAARHQWDLPTHWTLKPTLECLWDWCKVDVRSWYRPLAATKVLSRAAWDFPRSLGWIFFNLKFLFIFLVFSRGWVSAYWFCGTFELLPKRDSSWVELCPASLYRYCRALPRPQSPRCAFHYSVL